MRWRRGTRTNDVIDIRGARGGRRRAGGGMGGMPLPIGRAGGGAGLLVVLAIIAFQVLGGGGSAGGAFPVAPGFEDPASAPAGSGIPASQDPDRDLKEFSKFVVDHVQDRWTRIFADAGSEYERAKLVLFTSDVRTGGCGSAGSAVGPFYCPADRRVYLDLSFFRDMEPQLGAGGDFAWAYVIAHEVGHHVQNLLGTSDDVRGLQRERPDDANTLSVRMELQADCYAGVWGNSAAADGLLEAGDLEEAIRASEAIGDDRLQRRAGGDVDPDSFTHGTSEQRVTWFRTGQEQGDPSACDTFSVEQL